MEEWFINEPETEIIGFRTMRDDVVENLEEKIQKTGEDEPGWDQKFDRYHYYVKYFVIREGEIFDTSRRYTQARDSLEELAFDFEGVINSLVDVSAGYDNILVIEWGIQGKVIK